MEITSLSGDRFDIYIMDWSDLSNAYGENSTGGRSFSSIFSAENVAGVEETVQWEGEYTAVYLVIDNRDNDLLSTDAEPTGIIQVHVSLEITEEYYDYYD